MDKALTTYLMVKCLHIIGVSLFIGNIIVTPFWKIMAIRQNDPKIIAFAQKQIRTTDRIFTIYGGLVVFLSGLSLAMLSEFPIYHSPWVIAGFLMFIIAAIIWLVILVPTQRKQLETAYQFVNRDSIPENYWKLERTWRIFATLTILLVITAIVVMVLKPN